MSSKLKVLVTGSAGFIFSNFLRRAVHLKLPYTFVSIDNISKSHVLHNIYSNKNHIFYIGDISDEHFLNIIFEFERPDIVIHGAAEISDENKFIQSNVLGTKTITDACVKWKTQKLIYISTDEVYGQLTSIDAAPWGENINTNPRNFYASSKASGEMIVKSANIASNLVYNIIRLSNSYGPRQSTNKLIPKIIKSVLENIKIPIYGTGKHIRDWMYVDDACFGIMKILQSGEDNQIYNLSPGQEFSNLEVAQEVCNVLKRGHELISFVPDKQGHDFRYSMNSSKVKELGWKPEFKFREGIADTVEWYSNNKWFFKD